MTWYVYLQLAPGLERLIAEVRPLPGEKSPDTVARAVQIAKERELPVGRTFINGESPQENRRWEGHHPRAQA